MIHGRPEGRLLAHRPIARQIEVGLPALGLIADDEHDTIPNLGENLPLDDLDAKDGIAHQDILIVHAFDDHEMAIAADIDQGDDGHAELSDLFQRHLIAVSL